MSVPVALRSGGRSEARHLAHGKVPTAIGYPPFRAAAATLTRTQLDHGASVHRVARALGLPARSLTRWVQQSAPPVLRPVTLLPYSAPWCCGSTQKNVPPAPLQGSAVAAT